MSLIRSRRPDLGAKRKRLGRRMAARGPGGRHRQVVPQRPVVPVDRQSLPIARDRRGLRACRHLGIAETVPRVGGPGRPRRCALRLVLGVRDLPAARSDRLVASALFPSRPTSAKMPEAATAATAQAPGGRRQPPRPTRSALTEQHGHCTDERCQRHRRQLPVPVGRGVDEKDDVGACGRGSDSAVPPLCNHRERRAECDDQQREPDQAELGERFQVQTVRVPGAAHVRGLATKEISFIGAGA